MTSDPICAIYDCGGFDLICEESVTRYPCEAYVAAHSHLYDKPLRIMPKSQVREMIYYEGERGTIRIMVEGPRTK